MTETPQHPAMPDPQQPQQPYAGPPQHSAGPWTQAAPGADQAAPGGAAAFEKPAAVTAQAGEYAWASPDFQNPPGQLPPVPPELAFGAKPKRGPVKLGLGIVAAIAVLAAGIGGVSGAVFDHGYTSQSTAASVNVVTGSNSSDTTTTVGAVAKAALPSVVKITETTSSAEGIGSGMVISSNGYIVTNNHVIADYASEGGTLTVTTYDGKTYNAKVVGYIAADDIAVIQVEGGSNWTPVTFAESNQVQVGDQTIAIGSPDDLQNTVTSGIVSALNRTVSVSEATTEGQGFSGNGGFPGFNWGSQTETTVTYSAIQTDASINPGNSGGPLLDSAGQVIGMNSSIYSSSSSSSSSSSGSVGLGFAIPSDKVVQDIKKIEAGQGDSTSTSNSGTNGDSGTTY